ncbi:MAG: hypothetical protein QGI11_05520 [Nitrospinota bacterium]|nr:hypothetical protein [Nitrospinota bacterium]
MGSNQMSGLGATRKILVVAALAAAFSVIFHGGEAEARRRHRFGIGLHFLLLSPYLLGHRHHSHDHYPDSHHYGGYSHSPSIYLEDSDRFLLSENTQYALEKVRSWTQVKWSNPRTGIRGAVVAKPAFKNAIGQFCREYEQTLRAGIYTRRGIDTACRLPSGRWENALRN